MEADSIGRFQGADHQNPEPEATSSGEEAAGAVHPG